MQQFGCLVTFWTRRYPTLCYVHPYLQGLYCLKIFVEILDGVPTTGLDDVFGTWRTA